MLADQRQRLLDAVPSVVAEQGYEAMSVADIVKRAAVSRNAFYKNFGDKHECFAAAHEAGHEQLLEAMTAACESGTTPRERVERSLGVVLDALASDPALARLLFVEAPSSAGEDVARRHHEWLQRYGTLLRSVNDDSPEDAGPVEIDQVIVGGIASQIAAEVLQGDPTRLADLTPRLTDYVLAFYGPAQPDPRSAGEVVELEPETSPAYSEARRRQAGA